MKRTPVESSMLVSVGYDPIDHVLELQFTSGNVYQYAAVPEGTWRELMAAESKGRYFLDVIDHAYPCARVSRAGGRRRRAW